MQHSFLLLRSKSSSGLAEKLGWGLGGGGVVGMEEKIVRMISETHMTVSLAESPTNTQTMPPLLLCIVPVFLAIPELASL